MRTISHARPALWLALMALLTGCQGIPDGALKLSPAAAKQRELQTHRFEGVAEARLLAAGLGVMQDLGFAVEGTESSLGVLTGSRKLTSHRPLNSGEVISKLALTAWIPYLAPFTAYGAIRGVKEPQVVRISLVTQPDPRGSPAACLARVTAQRIVYEDEQLTKMKSAEPLTDPRFFAEFFERLSLSVFLEEGKS